MIAAILSAVGESHEIASVIKAEIPGESSLEVVFEGRKLNCYVCEVRGYMRTQYSRQKLPQVEKEEIAKDQNNDMEYNRD